MPSSTFFVFTSKLCVKCPCNIFVKHHCNLYFCNNNNMLCVESMERHWYLDVRKGILRYMAAGTILCSAKLVDKVVDFVRLNCHGVLLGDQLISGHLHLCIFTAGGDDFWDLPSNVVGRQEGHPACKKLGVGSLVVMI